jgi:DMSO/TMAO reductase YedYZ molybdopterin-dependent catalytic subunit
MNKTIKTYIAFFVIVIIAFAVIIEYSDTAPVSMQNSSNRAKVSSAKSLFEKQLEISLKNADKITKNSSFFSVSIKGVPQIDITKYRLTVDGLVENPQNFSYDEIIKMQQIDETETLTCISLISDKAVWSGVPLSEILKKVKPKNGATEVVFYAADGYSSSIPLENAMKTDVILATEMNGEILPAKHGFPLRLVYPGYYGYKWVKWIAHIKVINYNYKGFWESQGYSNTAKIKLP